MPTTVNPNHLQGSGSYTDIDPTAPRQPRNELQPDDFLKLFTEQLKHQNPMKPTDSNSILQTMSQLSALKSNNKMQDTLKSLQENVNSSLANTQFVTASHLINRKVEVVSDVSPLNKEGLNGSVSVPAGATNVTIAIKDTAGNTVKTIPLGNPQDAKHSGLMDFSWDGKKGEETDADGTKHTTYYDPGLYKISATAVMNNKEQPLQYTMGTFNVNSVALGNDGVVLNLQDKGGTRMVDVVKIL
jgi:flagellar basal-body rod modification protein FlgD